MNPNEGLGPAPRMTQNNSGTQESNNSDYRGRRARLRPKPAAMQKILGSSRILSPLQASNGGSNGLVWPYQPTINYQQDVEYQSVPMVHTNQEFYAYTRTNALKFTCEGEFTVQNQLEGRYALACIHFLRTVTKMYFGSGTDLGTPPPVLLFDAFGDYMFNALPVIVTSFSSNMPKDVDYVPVDTSLLGNLRLEDIPPTIRNKTTYAATDKVSWVPTVFTISVSMTVQQTPSVLRTFNLDAFRNGNLLGGWI